MYVNFLTNAERQTLLTLLSEQAPDYILLRAAESTIDERIQMRIDMTEITKAAKKVPTVASSTTNVVQSTTNNVTPPGDAAARITPASEEAIIRELTVQPLTATALNAKLKGKLDNTSRLLKLLWTRNKITFDGVRFDVEGV